MTSLQSLAGVLGLSFVSGINLYAAVLVVGLGIRYKFIEGVPPELHLLAHPAVLGVAGLFYVVEFFADKIPFVSAAWDTVHTFIRPFGGALLALEASAALPPVAQLCAFFVGGSVALGSHSTKMGVRLLAHTSPEPVSHSIISIAEDLSVIGLVLLAYKYPTIALVVFLALLVGIILLTPLLFRALRFMLRCGVGRLLALIPGSSRYSSASLPVWLDGMLAPLLPARNERVYPCFVRSFENSPARLTRGYLICAGDSQYFICRRLFQPRIYSLGGASPPQFSLHPGVMFDVLSFVNKNNRHDTVYLTKDWSRRLAPRGTSVRTVGDLLVQR